MTSQTTLFSPRVIVGVLIFVVLAPFLPLLISSRWDWWEAWTLAIVYILSFVLSRAVVARRDPSLIAERARFLNVEDAKAWDKVLAPMVGLGGSLLPLVAGLQARFAWSPMFNPGVKIVALLLILAGFALGSYALIENRFFSGMVRIQKERDHRVVTTGPYAWVRHPGYAGSLLFYIAVPVFLDTIWAFLPAIFLAIVLIIRTHLEDKMLHKELDGYRNYAERVRYRLLPGIW